MNLLTLWKNAIPIISKKKISKMLTFGMGNRGRKTKKRRKNGMTLSLFVPTAAV